MNNVLFINFYFMQFFFVVIQDSDKLSSQPFCSKNWVNFLCNFLEHFCQSFFSSNNLSVFFLYLVLFNKFPYFVLSKFRHFFFYFLNQFACYFNNSQVCVNYISVILLCFLFSQSKCNPFFLVPCPCFLLDFFMVACFIL